MNNCYIISSVSISAQNSFEQNVLLGGKNHAIDNKLYAQHPNYKEYISPIDSRRMSPAVRMSVVSAIEALNRADVPNLDGIITGTGMGCIEDTEKFLNLIISNEEDYLTPTSFIQSTHNTVAAQIALHQKCYAYNNTYVQTSNSFPSALVDAQLLLTDNTYKNILVGGVDELGKEFIDYVAMLENSRNKGIKIPFGEGASFFVLSNSPKHEDHPKLLDVACLNKLDKDNLGVFLRSFLESNRLDVSMIDVLIIGNNGDEFDSYYDLLVPDFKDNATVLKYKELCGEYFTAPAFSFWLAHSILKEQVIPENLLNRQSPYKSVNNILLYNQFKGKDHSFILLSI